MPARFVVMGDVIGSSDHDASRLSQQLARQVAACNRDLAEGILSPLTITLGDEFQGLAHTLGDAVACVLYLDETSIAEGRPFQLRYVIHEGEIETPINRKTAYGMLGPALTRARTLLSDKPAAAALAREILETDMRGRARFLVDTRDRRRSDQLTRLFAVADGIQSRWREDDCPLVTDMLRWQSNVEVAARHGKNRSQVWKRRTTLLIEEYRLVKMVIEDLARQPGEGGVRDDRPGRAVGLRHR